MRRPAVLDPLVVGLDTRTCHVPRDIHVDRQVRGVDSVSGTSGGVTWYFLSEVVNAPYLVLSSFKKDSSKKLSIRVLRDIVKFLTL